MDKKSLAKAALCAMVVAGSAQIGQISAVETTFNASGLLAASCGGNPSSQPPPSGGGYYGRDPNARNNYSQSQYYMADDTGSSYATPTSPEKDYGTASPSTERFGGGYSSSNWSESHPMTGGGSQTNPYSSDQRYQSGAYRNGNAPMGGGKPAGTAGYDTTDPRSPYNTQR